MQLRHLIFLRSFLETIGTTHYLYGLQTIVQARTDKGTDLNEMHFNDECPPEIQDEIKDYFLQHQAQFKSADWVPIEIVFFQLFQTLVDAEKKGYRQLTHQQRIEYIQQYLVEYQNCHPKFQLLSDLHFELLPEPLDLSFITAKAPFLLLLGDIGNPQSPHYQTFLTQVSHQFKHVYVIAGNHEYYRHIFDETNKSIAQICAKFSNVTFLNNSFSDVPNTNIRILGATLWTHIPNASKPFVRYCVNDYRQIFKNADQKLTVEDTNELHHQTVKWIKQESRNAAELGKEVLVCTHHAPLIAKAVSPTELAEDKINGQICGTSLHKLLHAPIKVWAFGHTHYNCDFFRKNRIRLISNQKGYSHEKTGFTPDKTFTM